MSEANWLSLLVQFEEAIHFSTPPPVGAAPFVFLRGDAPILLSAPHSTIHLRNGRTKRADGFTGAFVKLLHQLTGAHALYANYRLFSDPNWDRYAPYKALLGRVVERYGVRFIFDLHGMSNWHKVGVALGTINGRSCPDEMPLIWQTLRRHGFEQFSATTQHLPPALDWRTVIVDHPRFTGGLTSHTITRYATEHLRVSALQLELCASIRLVLEKPEAGEQDSYFGNGRATLTTLRALRDLICNLY